MCRTIIVLSCLGLVAGNSQWPQGSCLKPELDKCCDVDQANNAKCTKHVRWAMKAGEADHAKWYEPYGVEKGASFANFQCALYWIGYNEAKHQPKILGEPPGVAEEQHECPRPCAASVLTGCDFPPVSLDPEFTTTVAPVILAPVTTAAPITIAAPSFKIDSDKCLPPGALTGCKCGVSSLLIVIPGDCADPNSLECLALDCKRQQCEACTLSLAPWMILLIVILVLAVIAALRAWIYGAKKKGESNTKRGLKRKDQIEPSRSLAPAHVLAPAPPSMTMEPVETRMSLVPMDMQHAQSPRTTMMIPQPVQTTSMPMIQYAAQPQQQPQIMQYAAAVQQQPQMMQYAGPGTPQAGVMLMR